MKKIEWKLTYNGDGYDNAEELQDDLWDVIQAAFIRGKLPGLSDRQWTLEQVK